MYLIPDMWATKPLVSGTVANHRNPMANEKINTVLAVIGVRMNQAAAIERPASVSYTHLTLPTKPKV